MYETSELHFVKITNWNETLELHFVTITNWNRGANSLKPNQTIKNKNFKILVWFNFKFGSTTNWAIKSKFFNQIKMTFNLLIRFKAQWQTSTVFLQVKKPIEFFLQNKTCLKTTHFSFYPIQAVFQNNV